MTPEEKRKAHAAYMREYLAKNKEAINARRRELNKDPERKAKKSQADKAYKARRKILLQSQPEVLEALRQKDAERTAAYRAKNPEKAYAAKKRWWQSTAGQASRRRAYLRSKESGLAKKWEDARSSRPLTEPRRAAQRANTLARRSSDRLLDELSRFALKEAVRLSKLRSVSCGGKWEVDHIIPCANGGTSRYDNIQVVPMLWNRKKSNSHNARFFMNSEVTV